MSAQKLLSEAEKLLDKGKAPEAIEKLKQALKAEPLNQLVATRLANVHAALGDPPAAAKVFSSLADRLSEAGKAQVAIAIYKQALEFTPNDVVLKVKFAYECESAGKLGDALGQAQAALKFFLRRKKYFDAANLMPLLARLQAKDEKIKLAWIDIMLHSQAEQKLPHLLVASCGPPGIASQEFPVGGDPLQLSDAGYDGLKRLVHFFPRDPKVAYTVAWAAYRRERMADCFIFLRESLRRDPDFTLSSLLLARIFAERQRLNESLFIYKHLKDRMSADKSVDMVTLNRQVEGFVEKNGWLAFTDGMGADELDAANFLAAFGAGAAKSSPSPVVSNEAPSGAEDVQEDAPRTNPSAPVAATPSFGASSGELPPAEIELSLGEEGGGEIEFTGGNVGVAAKHEPAPIVKPAQAPAAKVEQRTATEGASVTITPAPANSTSSDPDDDSVEFTSIIRVQSEDPSRLLMIGDMAAKATTPEPGPEKLGVSSEVGESLVEPIPMMEAADDLVEQPPPASTSARGTFNPLEQAVLADSETSSAIESAGEKTQMFSPMDLLGAANIIPAEVGSVKTRIDIPPPAEKAAAPKSPPVAPLPFVEGPITEMFSPVEAIRAATESRRSLDAPAVEVASTPPPAPPPPPSLAVSLEPAVISQEAAEAELVSPPAPPRLEAEATTIMPIPPGFLNMASSPSDSEADQDNPIVPAEVANVAEVVLSESPEPTPPAEPVAPLPPPSVTFASLPEISPPSVGDSMPMSAASEGDVDLGEDLLDGPTKMIVALPPVESTVQMLREIKEEIAEKEEGKAQDTEAFFRRAERYIAKRNYYLARKALRHALALGADEERVKGRLRDVRKLEMPNSLYGLISSDGPERELAGDVLDRLEQEFDLGDEAEHEAEEVIGERVQEQIEQIFRETDPRTILDFGVGLHEMGLYRQAESVFARIVEDFPELSFDAYYLAAVAKFSRKDYAGAVSILKMLSGEAGKSELEKIQIYYALGELFEKMRRPESRDFFRKVAELDANYRNVRHKLDAKEP